MWFVQTAMPVYAVLLIYRTSLCVTCCSNAVFTPNEAVRAITGAIINAYELPVQRCVEMAAALLRDVITNCSQEVTRGDGR